MKLKPIRTVAPTQALVTLSEVKAQCRVLHGDHDALLSHLAQVATEKLDGWSGWLGRALITQTWKVLLCDWPRAGIALPLAPVQSITSVKYYDASNVQQTLVSSNYSLLEADVSPYISWTASATLPGVYDRDDAIEVIFVAGYGSNLADVPQAIRQAALMLVEWLYVPGMGPDVPAPVKAIVNQYRRHWL